MNYPAGKSLRLTKRTDISRVFTEGRRFTDARLTLWAIPTQQQGGANTKRKAPTDASVPAAAAQATEKHPPAPETGGAARLDFMIVPRAGADLRYLGVQESLRALGKRFASGRKDAKK